MSSLQLLQKFDTALLNPQPPTTTDNTCIGTSKKGERCKRQLSFYAIQRVANLVTSLRFTDPQIVQREHLTLGEGGDLGLAGTD
ncbi:uncharacterized protein N0V89_007247 [Didymosphaeria variabile]|uniref:Uncharacterized protein n=1 Tax=Didymosphaeria variabile TaxID=1932322 RepID=A0A9W8XKQ0_9PLEO|nr:uncharacterized protein N0V89_007247 [Didymosphaeria variabile]KAJ4351903.1 hypothetical protein N0V89_007247 [Didymosphaeria variabile]